MLLEQLANLIEACELLPMYDLPSRVVLALQEDRTDARARLSHFLPGVGSRAAALSEREPVKKGAFRRLISDCALK